MTKFNQIYKDLIGEDIGSEMVTVSLQLSRNSIRRIEQVAEADIASLLEDEINNNPDAFIEMMGFDR